MRVVLASEAANDLMAIGDFIASDNPVRADSFVRELLDQAEGLALMPRAFPLVPRFERHGIRRRVHGHYLIFYVVQESMISVIRILHGAQDYDRLLIPED